MTNFKYLRFKNTKKQLAMGNEDARKLALSTLRFEQQPKPQSEATSKGQRPDLIPHKQ